MAREFTRGDRRLHMCEECGLAYESRDMAEACEDYCSTQQSCSMEITRHAV